jgi:molybdenum cofactor cytidylyltransferase
MSKVAAVLLAAGLSTRLPANKLLQPFRGKPLVCHAAEAARTSRASPLIVVTGHNAREVAAVVNAAGVITVDNSEFSTGLSSSLKCGVRSVPAECEGALILLGDMPFVTPALIDALLDAFEPAKGREVIVPVHHGRRGNPVLWGRRFFPALLALTGDRGGKQLMALHPDLLYQLEVPDDGCLIDLDTAEDF